MEKLVDSSGFLKQTLDHKARVTKIMNQAMEVLKTRAARHDESKLTSPEYESYLILGPRLADPIQREQAMRDLQPALEHHYTQESNSHHPEHFDNDISKMSAFDIIEWLCDIKAYGEERGNLNFDAILAEKDQKYGFGERYEMIWSTAVDLGLIS